jgi:hypothetical protein
MIPVADFYIPAVLMLDGKNIKKEKLMSIVKMTTITLMFFYLMVIFSGCFLMEKQRSNAKDRHIDVSNDVMSESSMRDVQIYTDKRFNFSVEYPKEWTTKIVGSWDATTEVEASPDSGIIVYVDGNVNESIYVYGQVSLINVLQEEGMREQKLVTRSGITGTLYSVVYKGKREVTLILGEGFVGAKVMMSDDCFKRNEDMVMTILKSVHIL